MAGAGRFRAVESLGSAGADGGLGCADALGFVVPQMAQAGLITIPIWRRLLTRGTKAAA